MAARSLFTVGVIQQPENLAAAFNICAGKWHGSCKLYWALLYTSAFQDSLPSSCPTTTPVQTVAIADLLGSVKPAR